MTLLAIRLLLSSNMPLVSLGMLVGLVHLCNRNGVGF